MSVAAIVVAAGSGERLGAGVPKAMVALAGRPIVDWAITAFHEHPDVDSVVVVAPPEAAAAISNGATGRATVVGGGLTRQQSVRCGIDALDPGVDLVLVHDAARPLVTVATISSVIAALRAGADAVIPVLPVTDTVKRVDRAGVVLGTVERADLRSVQTPQGFRRDVLNAAHASASARGVEDATDDAGLVEAIGRVVVTVPGSDAAFKITTPYDLHVAECLTVADRRTAASQDSMIMSASTPPQRGESTHDQGGGSGSSGSAKS
jgi:2-C-methyl-D-erythritol 4-phosphate cytidylyltransferase